MPVSRSPRSKARTELWARHRARRLGAAGPAQRAPSSRRPAAASRSPSRCSAAPSRKQEIANHRLSGAAIDRARAASRAVCAMPWRPIAARRARIAPTTCGGAAPGAASRARCAAASQRSATSRSPRATRVVAAASARIGRDAICSSSRRSSQRSTERVGLWPANVGMARQSRLAARSASPAAIAWSSAAARSPCSSCQALARRWTSSSSRGSPRRRRARSAPLTRGCTRNCSSERSRAVTGRPDRASRRRVRPSRGGRGPRRRAGRTAAPAGRCARAARGRRPPGRTGARPRRSRRRSGRHRRTGSPRRRGRAARGAPGRRGAAPPASPRWRGPAPPRPRGRGAARCGAARAPPRGRS